MNHIILTIAAIFTFCCPSSFAGKISKDDGPVMVVVKEKLTSGRKQTNHAPARVLIESCYYPQTGTLELSFLANFGTVTVSLENMTDGGFQDYYGNSSSGKMLIPVDPDSAYRMDIVTESGRSYYAVFFTDEDCE